VVSDTPARHFQRKVELPQPFDKSIAQCKTDGRVFRAEQLAVGTYEVGVEQAGVRTFIGTREVVLSLGANRSSRHRLSPASASEK